MKVRGPALVLLLALAALLFPHPAAADGAQVESFVSTATLSRNDLLDVTEDIVYNPAGSGTDPLWRSIPLTYIDDQGSALPVRFRLVSVKQGGTDVPPHLTVTPSSARIALTPGTASGDNHFELQYTLTPVVMKGVTKDVFKVSFTDLSFNVPILRAEVKLTTPGLTLGDPACSTGSSGTTSAHCEITQSANKVHAITDAALGPGEALSLNGTFPRHSFTAYLEPHTSPLAWLGVAFVAAIPIGALVLIVTLALRRARR